MNNNIIQFRKKKVERGIILSGLAGVQNELGPVAKDVSPADMMYYALYWNKITVTQIPMFDFRNEIMEQFRSNGILDFYQNAPPSRIHSAEMQRLALESLLACLSVRRQEKNIDWLIYNNVMGSFNTLDCEDLIETHAIRVEIAECLPYPSTYVPIDTLLRFKEKYSDLLEELNIAQYDVFKVISEFDEKNKKELSRQYEISRFEKAVQEYQKAFAAKYPFYSLKSLVTDIKSNKSSLIEVGAAFGDLALTGASFSAPLAIIKSALNIRGSKQKIHQAMENAPQFQYISSAMNEGIIVKPLST